MPSGDPTDEATEKLEQAEIAVFDAIRLLNYYQTESLMQAAAFLQNIVKELKAGRKKDALALPVVNRREAARIMGSFTSDQKRAGAEGARIGLAKKRGVDAELRRIRGD